MCFIKSLFWLKEASHFLQWKGFNFDVQPLHDSAFPKYLSMTCYILYMERASTFGELSPYVFSDDNFGWKTCYILHIESASILGELSHNVFSKKSFLKKKQHIHHKGRASILDELSYYVFSNPWMSCCTFHIFQPFPSVFRILWFLFFFFVLLFNAGLRNLKGFVFLNWGLFSNWGRFLCQKKFIQFLNRK